MKRFLSALVLSATVYHCDFKEQSLEPLIKHRPMLGPLNQLASCYFELIRLLINLGLLHWYLLRRGLQWGLDLAHDRLLFVRRRHGSPEKVVLL
jgi:hypothetical protein